MKTGDTSVTSSADAGSKELFEDLFGDLLDEDAPFIPTESASNDRTLSFADEPFLTGSTKRTPDDAVPAVDEPASKADVLPLTMPAWLSSSDPNTSTSKSEQPVSMIDSLSDSALARALVRVLVQRGLVTEQEILDEARALQRESSANLK